MTGGKPTVFDGGEFGGERNEEEPGCGCITCGSLQGALICARGLSTEAGNHAPSCDEQARGEQNQFRNSIGTHVFRAHLESYLKQTVLSFRQRPMPLAWITLHPDLNYQPKSKISHVSRELITSQNRRMVSAGLNSILISW